MVNFFIFLTLILFYFVVAMNDLLYNVETIHDLCYVIIFLKMRIAVSLTSLIFQKRFPHAVST